MTTTLKDLLGEELIEYNQSDDQFHHISTNQLHGKTLALYFSAHWCSPCKSFTPKLIDIYINIEKNLKDKLDIVFISCDDAEGNFNEYLKQVPWKALPFHDRVRVQTLREKFNVENIPCLIVLSESFQLITSDGFEEIRCSSKEAVQKWIQGKPLFWSLQSNNNQHLWSNIFCTKCFMYPLIGLRFGSIDKDNSINLCQSCFNKEFDKSKYIEYLIPKQSYSLEKILSSISYLIDPKQNKHIPTKTIFDCNLKAIGFYFSALWCPPCRVFTPKLAEYYTTLQKNENHFQILFLSCDQDEESFNNYRLEMPWLSAPFNSAIILKEYFQISGIPSLIIVSSNGEILSRRGRDDVARYGFKALQTWNQKEKLIRPKGDLFEWSYVQCNQCLMVPLIGQRYSCTICEYYNLCSKCQLKGHQHELILQPQPDDDDQEFL